MEARRILSFFELPEYARPPRQIWHSVDKCADFVKRNMDRAMKGDSTSGGLLEFSDLEQEHG